MHKKNRILIKIGGRAFADRDGFRELAHAIKLVDADVALVHGGGSEISQALQDAGREFVFVDGVRATNAKDIEIVERVLSETINSRIAGYLSEFGVACTRLSGKSQSLLIAHKILRNGRDIGHVGQVVRVNPEIVWRAWENGSVPVVSPISANEQGVTFNVNADTAAAALAVGAQCTDLVYFSDVPGVKQDGDSVIPTLSVDAGKFLIQTGIISGGMVAKMESIFHALERDVQSVHITKWQGTDTLQHLLENKEIVKTTIHI